MIVYLLLETLHLSWLILKYGYKGSYAIISWFFSKSNEELNESIVCHTQSDIPEELQNLSKEELIEIINKIKQSIK